MLAEECITELSDTDDETLDEILQRHEKKDQKAKNEPREITDSMWSLKAKPTKNNPMDKKRDIDLSTFDSIQNMEQKFNYISMMEQEFIELERSDSLEESSSENDFTHLPNYEKIKHFEEDISEEEFMDIVINNLSKVEGDITYKMFREQFLPKHRKPSFADFARFRQLEKIMLAK